MRGPRRSCSKGARGGDVTKWRRPPAQAAQVPDRPRRARRQAGRHQVPRRARGPGCGWRPCQWVRGRSCCRIADVALLPVPSWRSLLTPRFRCMPTSMIMFWLFAPWTGSGAAYHLGLGESRRNSSALIAAAVRHGKDQSGLELSKCSQWLRLLVRTHTQLTVGRPSAQTTRCTPESQDDQCAWHGCPYSMRLHTCRDIQTVCRATDPARLGSPTLARVMTPQALHVQELHYRRSSGATVDAGEVNEVTVIFIADADKLVPSAEEWPQVCPAYALSFSF